jgi:superfamily II DNA/RNA helicase
VLKRTASLLVQKMTKGEKTADVAPENGVRQTLMVSATFPNEVQQLAAGMEMTALWLVQKMTKDGETAGGAEEE